MADARPMTSLPGSRTWAFLSQSHGPFFRTNLVWKNALIRFGRWAKSSKNVQKTNSLRLSRKHKIQSIEPNLAGICKNLPASRKISIPDLVLLFEAKRAL
jgi:hypothetical protein